MAAFKLLLDVAYLARLIGIKSILVGSVASFILIPLSTKLSKRHQTLQAEVSKTHGALSNLISEALQGLRQIRLSSMERVWEGKILGARAQELDRIWKAGVNLSFLTLVANLGPILLASVALSVYSSESGHLSPSVAFASLSLFGNLHEVFRDLPVMAANMHESWVSCQRIQQYLDEPEQNPSSVPCDHICLEEATLTWPRGSGSNSSSQSSPSPAAAFELRDVNLAFPKGKLSIVTGKTGSGKSLLMASILEEAKLESGRFGKPAPTASAEKGLISAGGVLAGTTALVSQPSWIENCTAKDNILFGYPFDEARYRKVVHACALDQDLNALSDGDLTKAGVNGAVLSGGQKWRVALARALYSPAEILILGDVLSAVDASVARWICDNALTGELVEGRTRILVTHHPELCLDAASYLVVVQDNTAAGSSKPEAHITAERTTSNGELTELTAEAPGNSEGESKAHTPAKSRPRQAASQNNWQIFSAYLWASGGVGACILGVLVTLGHQVSSASHSWWLARWTARSQEATGKDMMSYNIGVYLALSIGNGIALAVQSLVINSIGLGASRSLFRRMVRSVLAAPLGWIDSTPLGQVLQSLGVDMYLIDHRTAPEVNSLLGNVMHLLLIVLTSFISAPYTVFSSIALLILYFIVASQQFILSGMLKRLIPASHRPLLEHAKSTAAGLATIRAFGRSQFYAERMYDLVDVGIKVGWHLALGMRWMNVRSGVLGAMFVTTTAAGLVLKQVDAATAGFTITLALQLKTTLSRTLNKVGILNMGSNARDRVLNLAETPRETGEGEDPPGSWPSDGAVEAQNVTVRYDATLSPALKAVSFSLKPGQRLGIVGRTGAGKTSLTSAFLRFIDLAEGKIVIDGIDISTLRLARLRSAMTIIPQDPFLFSGTLRSNLDPQGDRTDGELRWAVGRVRLLSGDDDDDDDDKEREKEKEKKNEGGEFADLDMAIRPGGASLSHGQRQLICLARALLARCRILILDEATSAVDGATDAAIQRVIRDEFAAATILVVAHKLATVADLDAILVLSNGEVAEFGSPGELMARGEGGVFWDMVRQSGDGERIRAMIGLVGGGVRG